MHHFTCNSATVINEIQDIKQKVETETCTRRYSHALHNGCNNKTIRIVIIAHTTWKEHWSALSMEILWLDRDTDTRQSVLSVSVCLSSLQGCHYLFLSKDNFAAKWLGKNFLKTLEKAQNLPNCQELHSFILHIHKTDHKQKANQPPPPKKKTVQQCLKCSLAHHNTFHSFWECFSYLFQTSCMHCFTSWKDSTAFFVKRHMLNTYGSLSADSHR